MLQAPDCCGSTPPCSFQGAFASILGNLLASPHLRTSSIIPACHNQQGSVCTPSWLKLAVLYRRRWSRKTAAQRARRMAGQGLGPLMNKKPDILIAPPSRSTLRMARRDSPTYDPYRSGRASSDLVLSSHWPDFAWKRVPFSPPQDIPVGLLRLRPLADSKCLLQKEIKVWIQLKVPVRITHSPQAEVRVHHRVQGLERAQ